MKKKDHGQQYITKIKYKKVVPKVKIEKPKDETHLINKLVITGKNPSKKSKRLCMQLRKIFDPRCLTKLKELSPEFRDCLKVSDAYGISHLIIVYENEIHIGLRPKGPTYIFKIVEYEDNFKDIKSPIYTAPAFTTFEGRSELREFFENFGLNAPGFKRSLHFHFIDSKIYIRHYSTKMNDTEDNFRMGLKEIGPRLTLELKSQEEGFFTDLKKKSRNKPIFKKQIEKE